MKENVKKFISDMSNIKIITEYEFHELYGLTFVFKSEFFQVKSQISSVSIMPIGIIYDENNEYYFAPLVDDVDVNQVVKNYLEFID
ncbi:hypothetical protein [Methanobrevibacter sp.]|uniref:hypothetical protein n=1 Tax=Methanobrevibacter sp. TaxID=66852 RepID=UPI003D7DDF88